MVNNDWFMGKLGDVTFEYSERIGEEEGFQSIVYGVDRENGLNSTPKYTAATLERYKSIKPGMFVYNPMRLNIGSIGFCSREHRSGVVSPDYIVFSCDESKVIPEYLNYYIQGPDWQKWTTSAGVGSVRVRIYYKELANLPIQLPPITQQKEVVSILETIDAKRKVTTLMNQTLESIARTLFKSWFVDFDPVRAKAEGRDPGLPAEIADLFPDSFEESRVGEIPRGWRVMSLPEAVEINPRRVISAGQEAKYLDMQNMPTQGHCPDGWVMRAVGSGMKFMNGDTLVARITPCLENGKTAFVDFLKDGEVGWGSTEYIVLRPKEPLPLIYGYLLARSEDFRNFAIKSMTGTSGRQRVQVSGFNQYSIIVPSEKVCLAFTDQVTPFFEKIKKNSEQSRVLREIRDTLLPKLLNGEVPL